MTTTQHCEDLAEGYAVGALSVEESGRVTRHIAHCSQCRLKVDSFEEVADLLGLAVPLATPLPTVKGKLLARIAQEPAPFPVPPRRVRRVPLVWALATAAGIAAAVATGWGLSLQGQLGNQARTIQLLNQRTHQQEAMLAIMASPSLTVRVLQGSSGASTATGRFYLDTVSQRAGLVVEGMPVLPADRAYQFWLVAGSERVSGGVFTVDSFGRGWLVVAVPVSPATYQAVGITMEPARGSPGPTTPRLIGGQL